MSKFKEELQNLFTDAERNNVSYKEVEKMLQIHFNDWEPPNEKVVIPRFVADWIEYAKNMDYVLSDALFPNSFKKSYDNWLQVRNWLHVDNARDVVNVFARAWLDGYEVEKEQLYSVRFPNLGDDDEAELLFIGKYGKPLIGWLSCNHRLKHELTEKEIKAIDKRYWSFRVPVSMEEEK